MAHPDHAPATAEQITPPFEAVNLDDYSTSPEDYEGLAFALNRLACYATMKAEAIRLRHRGCTTAARVQEMAMDRLHDQLPLWARW